MNTLFEAIEKGYVSNVGFVCQGLTEISKQFPKDQNSVLEIYEFALQFFDRVFGEDTTSRSNTDLPQGWNRLPCGGWLRKLIVQHSAHYYTQLDLPLQKNNITKMHNINSSTIHLIQILSYHSPFLDILKRGKENFQLPLSFFPKKIQLGMNLQSSLYNFIRTDSQNIYFTHFQLWPKIKQSLSLSSMIIVTPIEYLLLCMMRYPTLDHTIFTPIPESTSYVTYSSPNHFKSSMPISLLLENCPYYILYQRYLIDLFPYNEQKSYLTTDVMYDPNFNPNIKFMSELFVTLAVEYWIDIAQIVQRDYRSYYEMQQLNTLYSNHMQRNITPSPLETLLIDDNLPSWTEPTMQCIFLLVGHLLCDPFLRPCVKHHAEKSAEIIYSYDKVNIINDKDVSIPSNHTQMWDDHDINPSSPSSPHMKANVPLIHPCPRTLQRLQKPLFNMLKLILSRGDQTLYSASVFHHAVDIWLLYLQPWNAIQTIEALENRTGYNGIIGEFASLTGTDSVLAMNNVETNSGYTSDWDYYIAANLHFYTTLLICFLQSLSVVSLDSTNPLGLAYFHSLEKVCKVFSTSLLQRVLSFQNEFRLNYCEQYSKIKVNPSDSTEFSTAMLKSALRIRTPFAIISNPLNTIDTTRGNTRTTYDMKISSELYMLMILQHHVVLSEGMIHSNTATHSLSHSNMNTYGIIDLKTVSHVHITRLLFHVNKLNYDINFSFIYFLWIFIIDGIRRHLSLVPYGTESNFIYSEYKIRFIIQTLENISFIFANFQSTTTTNGSSMSVPSYPLETEDLLEKPIYSYEWRPLAFLLIYLSKYFNRIYNLPRNRTSVTWSFSRVLQSLWTSSYEKSSLLDCFRFNFRYFASFTVLTLSLIGFISFLVGFQYIHQSKHFFLLLFISLCTVYFIYAFEIFVKDYNNLTNPNRIYDSFDAKLTNLGKQKCLHGDIIFHNDQIRFGGDNLLKPIHSFEWESFTKKLIIWSMQLNSYFNLPKNKSSIGWTWYHILLQAWYHWHDMNPLWFLLLCCRFNLRMIGSIRVMSFLLMILFLILKYCRYVSDMMLFVALIVGGIAFYYNYAPSRII